MAHLGSSTGKDKVLGFVLFPEDSETRQFSGLWNNNICLGIPLDTALKQPARSWSFLPPFLLLYIFFFLPSSQFCTFWLFLQLVQWHWDPLVLARWFPAVDWGWEAGELHSSPDTLLQVLATSGEQLLQILFCFWWGPPVRWQKIFLHISALLTNPCIFTDALRRAPECHL